MSLALQIVLCLAVVTLTVFLILLLVQARRTAAAMERLAEGAARDLHQMAEDVHEVRSQVDEVARVVKHTLELPSTLTQIAAGVAQALPALFSRRKTSTRWIDSLIAGIQTGLNLLHRPKPTQPKETPHE